MKNFFFLLLFILKINIKTHILFNIDYSFFYNSPDISYFCYNLNNISGCFYLLRNSNFVLFFSIFLSFSLYIPYLYITFSLINSSNLQIKKNMTKIIYILCYQITVPFILSTIGDKVNNSFMEIEDLNTVELRLEKLNIFHFTNWIASSLFFSCSSILLYIFLKKFNFNLNNTVIELMIIIPYFSGFTYGLYENLIFLQPQIKIQTYLLIIINLLILVSLSYYINNKIMNNIMQKFIYILYIYLSFYILFQTASYQIFLKINFLNLSKMIISELLRFDYLAILVGQCFQIFMTILTFKKLIKNNIYKLRQKIFFFIQNIIFEWSNIFFLTWIKKNKINFIFSQENPSFFDFFLIISLSFYIFFTIMNIFLYISKNLDFIQNIEKYIIVPHFLKITCLIIILFSQDIPPIYNSPHQISLCLFQLSLLSYLFLPKQNKKIQSNMTLTSQKFECFICLDSFQECFIFIPCGHWTCIPCYLKNNFQKCPTCRSTINKYRLYNGESCKIHHLNHINFLKINNDQSFICNRCYIGPGIFFPIYNLQN